MIYDISLCNKHCNDIFEICLLMYATISGTHISLLCILFCSTVQLQRRHVADVLQPDLLERRGGAAAERGEPRDVREAEAAQARAAGRRQQAPKVALVGAAVWLDPRVAEKEVAERGEGASAGDRNGERRVPQGEAHRLGSRRGRHRGG